MITMRVDIEPKTKMRLSLKMIESSIKLPASEQIEKETPGSPSGPVSHPPSSLYEWDDLEVLVHGDDLLFPESMEITE
jgi:hypothetical protein